MSTPSTPRLERPRDDRLLGGVCVGLARHLGADVTLVRVAVAVLALFGGLGVIAYLVALLIVPEEGAEQPFGLSGRMDADDRMPWVLGALVVAALLTGAGPLPWGWWDGGGWILVPATAIGLGLLVVQRRRADASAAEPAPAPERSADDTAVTEAIPARTAPAQVSAAPRRSRGATRVALGALLLAFGALGVLVTTVDDLAWSTAISLAVLACGVVAVAAAPFGGVRAVVGIGFTLAALGGVAAATDLELEGGFGDRIERPAAAANVDDEYRLAAGSLVVDLRDTRFPPGTTRVAVRVGVGEAIVRLPEDVTAIARVRAGAGEAVTLGHADDGGGVDVTAVTRRLRPTRVVVDAKVGLGFVEVEQPGPKGDVR